MPYVVISSCHGCIHLKEGCTDYTDIQQAVDKIHGRIDDAMQTHKGAGSIAIICSRRTDAIKETKED